MAQGASVHAETSELFYVIEGSATMLTGGKLVGETGKTIEGGVAQKFAPGDWLMVPSREYRISLSTSESDYDSLVTPAGREVGLESCPCSRSYERCRDSARGRCR